PCTMGLCSAISAAPSDPAYLHPCPLGWSAPFTFSYELGIALFPYIVSLRYGWHPYWAEQHLSSECFFCYDCNFDAKSYGALLYLSGNGWLCYNVQKRHGGE